jgi:hypothetical protein
MMECEVLGELSQGFRDRVQTPTSMDPWHRQIRGAQEGGRQSWLYWVAVDDFSG